MRDRRPFAGCECPFDGRKELVFEGRFDAHSGRISGGDEADLRRICFTFCVDERSVLGAQDEMIGERRCVDRKALGRIGGSRDGACKMHRPLGAPCREPRRERDVAIDSDLPAGP